MKEELFYKIIDDLCNIKYNRMEENALLSHELERLKQPVRSAKKESLL